MQDSNSLALISPCRKPVIVGSNSVLNPWEKVVVTVEEYDNWRAQMYGLTIKNFPKVQPPNMPFEIFNELKKKYVAPTKIRVKKKNQLQEIKVESRFMDWEQNQKRQRAQQQLEQEMMERSIGKKDDRRPSLNQRRQSMRRKSQAGSNGAHQMSAAGIETGSLTTVNESLVSGNHARLAKELAERDQGPRPPRMSDFKTSVFNRNSKPDTLISYIKPTKE